METTTVFYMPHKIELLFDFFNELNIKVNETYSYNKKEKVLKWIRKLLEDNILYAGKFNTEKQFEKWELSINQIIDQINIKWEENLEFSEFYNIVWFSYQEWYIEKLNKMGMTDTTNWTKFVNENLGNLEKWIQENKPNPVPNKK